jgi:nucleoside-triphosphatase
MKTAFLVTGRPGVGKTALIGRLVSTSGMTAGGFITREIRSGGRRRGFSIVTLTGETVDLASDSSQSPLRVARYGVDIAALDRIGVEAVRRALAEAALVIIDEIGKMELLSPSFKAVVRATLESGKPLLGTVMLAPHPWVDDLKRDPRVEVAYLDRGNRVEVEARATAWLARQTR